MGDPERSIFLPDEAQATPNEFFNRIGEKRPFSSTEILKIADFFELRTIHGKDVYVVDDHHKAMAAWSLIRRSSGDAPYLLTIDHHTDTEEAFDPAPVSHTPRC